MRVGQIVTLKKNTSRRLRVLAISDWDIVTVMDLADKTEKEVPCAFNSPSTAAGL